MPPTQNNDAPSRHAARRAALKPWFGVLFTLSVTTMFVVSTWDHAFSVKQQVFWAVLCVVNTVSGVGRDR